MFFFALWKECRRLERAHNNNNNNVHNERLLLPPSMNLTLWA